MDTSEIISQVNDANSESDFEIVCNSDDETDGNSYKKLSESPVLVTKKLNFQQLNAVNSEKLNLTPSKTAKINLSPLQEKILLNSKSKENLEEKRENQVNTEEFVPKFNITSAQTSAENKDSEKVKVFNLPEIVLASHEKNKLEKMLLRVPNTSIHMERKTPSPDLYHGSKLAASIKSSQIRRVSDGTAYSQETYNTTASKPLNLEKTLPYQMSVAFNHPSSSTLNAGAGLEQFVLFNMKESTPAGIKCRMCSQLYKDPRTLNCLHSFCFQCLVNENFGKDESIPFWSRPDGSNYEWKGNFNSSTKSSSHGSGDSDNQSLARPESRSSVVRYDSRSSVSSVRTKKSKDKSNKNSPKHLMPGPPEKTRILVCSICQFCTEMPIGGIRQLPQNLILVRKVEEFLLKASSEVISNVWCTLCCMEIPATYHCISCVINLCGFCKEAHDRQKTTAGHNVRNILDLHKNRSSAKCLEESRLNLKCALHPGFDLKSFCITCQQIICPDCAILLHKGHKTDAIHKAFKVYQKTLRDSTERSRPLCEYVDHSIHKLGDISKKINQKCDQVKKEVETFMAAYFEAVEVHKNTLFQQIARARETKMQVLLEQQMDLEKKSMQTKEAIDFTEELFDLGSEAEVLSFLSILLRRFEYCQKFKPPLDAKISDTLDFLPEVRAPSTKAQNNIPLYGIITTQTVEPQFCTLETEGYHQLRVHRKVELVVLSRDADGAPLCHGGIDLKVQMKYKESSSKLVETQVSDRRDGTYVITFVPEYSGTLLMSITINNRHIKGSPFTMIARTVRPHTGIFHCCTFCSSKGSKTATCACEGVMPGFKGCGHGHSGHPGRRHWSCCASILENSECSTANMY